MKPEADKPSVPASEPPARRASFQMTFAPSMISYIDRYYKRQFDRIKWEFVKRCAACTPMQTVFVLQLPKCERCECPEEPCS